MDATILVCNENFVPCPRVEVEAFDLSSGAVQQVASTDLGGLAVFTDLSDDLSIFYRPKFTRARGTERSGLKRLYVVG